MFTAAKGVLGFWEPAGTSTTDMGIYSTAFNYEDVTHLRVVSDRILQFENKLNTLMSLDYRIVMAAAICGVAYVGAYVFPLVLVSIAAASAASYQLGMREPIYREYREALSELIKVYKWSMAAKSEHYWYKLAVPQLQDLITTLGPYVSPATIVTWTEEDLKRGVLNRHKRRDDIPVEFEKRLTALAAGEQTQPFAYRLYGETAKSHILDILRDLFTHHAMPTITSLAPRQT